ncbi:MAG: CHASE2 domain-containing protein [Actinomycetota bacterium]
MRRTALFRLTAAVLIALGVTGLAWAGLAVGTFQQTQLRLEDGLFPAVGADPGIVVVGLDDATLDEVGIFPLPRDYHARLIDALAERGASWIGYDVTFSERTRQTAEELSEQDRALVDAVERAGNVILGVQGTFEGRLAEGIPRAASVELPFEELGEAAAGVASVNVFPDPDSVVRVYAPVIDVEGSFLDTLAFGLFTREEGVEGPLTLRPDGVQVGEALIPTGPEHLMAINFAPGSPDEGGFETYSLIDVVEGRLGPGVFRDKIVLVGATALGLGDTRLTPIDKQTGQAGVFVHANALNTMLTRAYLFPDGRGLTVAWIFALALVVAVSVAFLRVWLAPAVSLGAGAGYYLVAFSRFDRGRVMNLVYPALAVLVAYMAALAFRYFTEFRERRRVTHVFGRYVAEDVVEEVLAAPERALATLEGAERPISVLFADLRGFTAASDGASPTEVVAGLNIYLDAMVRAVNEEHGTIDKFMGDCVMAFWGAPRYVPNHAERAIKAALVMQDYIEEAKQRADEMGLRVPGVGVGVSTGAAVVGNIGSHERLDYTVIGDTVNTASRICGVAEAGEIVVTEECSAAVGDVFPITPLPPLKVKGKRELLKIFQVLRPGQEAKAFEEGATTEAHDEKAQFEGQEEAPAEGKQVEAPSKAAGYAPIEPRLEPPK